MRKPHKLKMWQKTLVGYTQLLDVALEFGWKADAEQVSSVHCCPSTGEINIDHILILYRKELHLCSEMHGL